MFDHTYIVELLEHYRLKIIFFQFQLLPYSLVFSSLARAADGYGLGVEGDRVTVERIAVIILFVTFISSPRPST